MNAHLIVENSIQVIRSASNNPRLSSLPENTKEQLRKEVEKVDKALRPETTIKQEIDSIIRVKMGID